MTIRRKRFSVVLEAEVRLQRTVVVSARDAAQAEERALKEYKAEYDRLGGWDTVPKRLDTRAFDCQEADPYEPLTEEA